MGDDDAAAEEQVGLALINKLASCNPLFRDEALRFLLNRWLPFQLNLTDDFMKKLWKGFFYCFWHPEFRSRGLIDHLSSLLPRLRNSSVSLHYFSSFLLTMRREWPGIDAGHRLEKSYLFIRRFLHYSFAFLKIHSWDLDLTSSLISLLEDTCFLVKQGNDNSFGVSHHIASVFLEELRPFLPLQPEVLEVVFKPFISVMLLLPDEVLFWTIKTNMFDVLLKMGNKLLEVKKLGDDNEVHDNDDAVVVFGTIGLTMGFTSKFFELGSSVDCCLGNRYRKVLFVLYKQFLKLEKDAAEAGLDNVSVEDLASAFEGLRVFQDLESSGIEVSIARGIDDDKRVPTLIPVGTDMEVNVTMYKMIDSTISGGGTKYSESGTTAKSGEKKSGMPGKAWDMPDGTKYFDDWHRMRYLEYRDTGVGSPDDAVLGRTNYYRDVHYRDVDYGHFYDALPLCGDKYYHDITYPKKEKYYHDIDIYNCDDAVKDAASACELPKTKANGTVSNKRTKGDDYFDKIFKSRIGDGSNERKKHADFFDKMIKSRIDDGSTKYPVDDYDYDYEDKMMKSQFDDLDKEIRNMVDSITKFSESVTTAESGEKRSGGLDLPGTGWVMPGKTWDMPEMRQKMSGTKYSDDIYSVSESCNQL